MLQTTRSAFAVAAVVIAGSLLLALPAAAPAQETSTTTVKPKAATGTMTIDSAQVVYVSGDDAVLKMSDGSVRLFELAPGTSLTIDGKPASASDLKPGMTLSHAQLHSRMQADVTTVTEVSGTVLAKSGRHLTLRLDDGTSKIYQVPYHATFNVNGQDTGFEKITKGMKISVTAVKTEGVTSQSSKAAMVAQTPQQQGTLVIVR